MTLSVTTGQEWSYIHCVSSLRQTSPEQACPGSLLLGRRALIEGRTCPSDQLVRVSRSADLCPYRAIRSRNPRRWKRELEQRLVVTMEYFVRYAKFWQSGVSTKFGWKVRIFATASEAHAFSQQMSLAGWRVEAGRFRDTRLPPYMEESGHLATSR